MEIVNKQRGTYEQFLGRNFIGLIALGIEIRGAWVIYIIRSIAAGIASAIKEFMGSLSGK